MLTREDYIKNPIIASAIDRAAFLHNEKVNQTYDGKPYFDTHVMAVFNIAVRYIHLIPVEHRIRVLVAVLFHDVIEDTGETYNDVKKFFQFIMDDKNEAYETVEIVFACTNFRGRTRSERACPEYYKGIRETLYADFVKICDRLANVTASCTNGHAMSSGYAKEHKHFKKELYINFKYAAMWYEMEEMLLTEEQKETIEVGKIITSNLDLNRKLMVVREIRISQTREDVSHGGEPEIVLYCSDITDCEMMIIPVRAQNVRRYVGTLFAY
jgi:(p)ppGpp synthase/HD superfamily hydrolase